VSTQAVAATTAAALAWGRQTRTVCEIGR
jgi:hypothetical protein